MWHSDPTWSIVDTAWFTLIQAMSVTITEVVLKTKGEELRKGMGSNIEGHPETEALKVPSLNIYGESNASKQLYINPSYMSSDYSSYLQAAIYTYIYIY